MLISRRTALLGTAAAASLAAPVAMAEYRVAEHEPLIDLWQEYQRRRAVHAAMLKRASAASAAGDHEGCSRLEDESGEYDSEFVFHGVEHEICMSQARTTEGAVIQARLLLDYVAESGTNEHQDVHLARNLLAGLERLGGRSS